MKKLFLATTAAAIAIALTGCSQVAALTPVGGDRITTVRNAVYDVLVDQQVAILRAPQCTAEETEFTCVGTTVDGREIRATAEATAPYPLTITVDSVVIFTGEAQQVIDDALLEGS